MSGAGSSRSPIICWQRCHYTGLSKTGKRLLRLLLLLLLLLFSSLPLFLLFLLLLLLFLLLFLLFLLLLLLAYYDKRVLCFFFFVFCFYASRENTPKPIGNNHVLNRKQCKRVCLLANQPKRPAEPQGEHKRRVAEANVGCARNHR